MLRPSTAFTRRRPRSAVDDVGVRANAGYGLKILVLHDVRIAVDDLRRQVVPWVDKPLVEESSADSEPGDTVHYSRRVVNKDGRSE